MVTLDGDGRDIDTKFTINTKIKGSIYIY